MTAEHRNKRVKSEDGADDCITEAEIVDHLKNNDGIWAETVLNDLQKKNVPKTDVARWASDETMGLAALMIQQALAEKSLGGKELAQVFLQSGMCKTPKTEKQVRKKMDNMKQKCQEKKETKRRVKTEAEAAH